MTQQRNLNDSANNLPPKRPNNWYVTPHNTIDFAYSIFKELLIAEGQFDFLRRSFFQILDIYAGTGRWGLHFLRNILADSAGERVFVRGVEFNPIFERLVPCQFSEYYWKDVLHRDWRSPHNGSGYDLIVGNPDFSAFYGRNFSIFLQNITNMLSDKGWGVFLVSNSILSSQGRSTLYNQTDRLKLRHVEVLNARNSFNPIFHPEQGKVGAQDHVLLYFQKTDNSTQDITISGGRNKVGNDTAWRGVYWKKDTFLHQLPFGLWDFAFVAKDKKGKTIRYDNEVVPTDSLALPGGLSVLKHDSGYTIRKDEDHTICFGINKTPTIPQWIWSAVFPEV